MTEKQLIKITVDTNNIIVGGLTTASLRRLPDGEIDVGDAVIAHDIAEEVDFSAVVVALVGNKAHLRLDWDSAKPWDSEI